MLSVHISYIYALMRRLLINQRSFSIPARRLGHMQTRMRERTAESGIHIVAAAAAVVVVDIVAVALAALAARAARAAPACITGFNMLVIRDVIWKIRLHCTCSLITMTWERAHGTKKRGLHTAHVE